VRMSGSIGCDTQMPSSVKANLLDDGVVDTLGSVGATSDVQSRRDALTTLRVAITSTCLPVLGLPLASQKMVIQPHRQGRAGPLFVVDRASMHDTRKPQ
jgi:hypothetical protein